MKDKFFTFYFLLFTLMLVTPINAQDSTPVPLSGQYGFGDLQSLGEALSRVTPAVIGLATTMVAFYLIIAAIKFIVSEGDKASVSEAKKTITHTLIGIMLLILVFAFIKFVPEFFNLGFKIF